MKDKYKKLEEEYQITFESLENYKSQIYDTKADLIKAKEQTDRISAEKEKLNKEMQQLKKVKANLEKRVNKLQNAEPMDVLIRIANALDTSVDNLLSGVQQKDNRSYESEVGRLMNDCTSYEKRIIYETVKALKNSLKENKSIIEDEIIYSIQTNW